jgi:hypothetical protein
MPPRIATRRHPIPQSVNSTAQGNDTPHAADSITQVQDRMAQATERVTEPTRHIEPEPDTREDRALERFLKFNSPLYSGKPNTVQVAASWVEQLENIYAVLRYEDLRKVHFTSFRLLGLPEIGGSGKRRNMTLDNKYGSGQNS